METLAIFCLALAYSSFFSGALAGTFTITNKCPYTVWPATLASAGRPQLSKTGFQLSSGSSSSIDNVPGNWIGRVWARTKCATDAAGKFTCATADCGSGQIQCNGKGAIPPASLAEFTLNGDQRKDFYDLSLVDGYNLPLSITPQGGSPGCKVTSCQNDVNKVCPQELAVKGRDGSTIACKSACVAFNKPNYCCTGNFNKPETCPPTNYSKIFKNQCPQAYSYAYDDKSSTFTCPTGRSYLITFCP
ncbi:hypothetical protein K2173_019488 [Erythroxylum novogranatense]|uniref:Thaumatin-like protein n=1 Tax=Erythroxylum novogranatense TaxID=1862640 RepID=A0AAV8UE25_9ROSI|nr:hypothetical protein K2173_019488 [Erythroxylum novogranatense]